VAIRSDGTLAAWGDNSFGAATAPGGTYLAVAAGHYHNVAIKSDGTLVAWGLNDFGQNNVPAGIFTAISAGNRFSYGITPVPEPGTMAALALGSIGLLRLRRKAQRI
jgi:hypothetical protein